jgi:bile acid:Na+ symporter, BASS family
MPLVKLLALVMIVSTMFGAGLQVDHRQIVETLRRYGLIGRALLANFVLVPLFALVAVRFFHLDRDVAVGIVLMSMAPGVPFLVNAGGRDRGGSLSLALTISFLFSALSVVTIPLTIALIALAIPSAPTPGVPGVQFLTTLVVGQLVPLVAGALLGPRLPDAAREKIVKVLHLAFVAGAVVLLVLIFPKLASAVTQVYGYGKLLVMAAIAAFSAAAGWLLGGPERAHRRTLTIGTMLRNVGLCALIGTDERFANTLVLPSVMTYFLVAFALSLPIRVFFTKTKDAPAA